MIINKKVVSTLILLASINVGSAWAKEQVIGFIDREQIMTKSMYAKDAQETVKKQFKSRMEALEVKQKKLLTEKETLDRDRDILGEAELKKRFEKIQNDFNNLRVQEEEFTQEVEAFEIKSNKKILAAFIDAAAQLAKENNLDIVLPAEIAIHGAKKFDYTFRAVELMDKKFKESKS
jgi:outer membrane protein